MMKATQLLGAVMIASYALVSPAFAAHGEEWMTDYDQALAKAKAEKKPVLINFSGSDWCGPCIMMERDLFSTEEFKAFAKENLVLLLIDFPMRKPLPFPQQARNEQLKERYGVQGFPTVIFADATGKPFATTGYAPMKPADFIKEVKRVLPKK